jgi:protein tyrosine phosphatase (PTP) superfamily phosphohydrolase (DUF442 family)|tara:strand:- start:950 stop:1477 length:528 start_codon:yes stop_codon:yes gene_type:complete
MKLLSTAMFISLLFMPTSGWATPMEDSSLRLKTLNNYQINTPVMVSSGLPNRGHFEALKSNGVANVIDLLPGDRREEISLVKEMGLNYKNIEVQWGNPTLENFDDYVAAMQRFESEDGMTLTHCQLNWRGAVFTYLYRITQLREAEHIARQDMDAIWKANEVWLKFIEEVKNKYL